jgi:hypothetical protein
MERRVGFIVMCQSLISIAVSLAVLGVFGNMGGALSLTFASAIWQAVFPTSLRKYLPEEELPNLNEIYADLSTQLSCPIGSETRIAIQHAYGHAQVRMLTVGTAF